MTRTSLIQCIFAAAIGCGALCAQPLPDAKFLMAHTGDELQKHKTYQMEIATSMSANSAPSITSVFGIAPDRMRMESSDLTIVADGQNTWVYVPSQGTYTKSSAIGGIFTALDSSTRGYIGGLKSAFVFNTVRQEKLEIDGQVLDCWVIEMKSANPNQVLLPEAVKGMGISYSEFSGQYWIDKDTGLERQQVATAKFRLPNTTTPQSVEIRTVHRSIKFDEPLPDSLFQFTPPAGAKEMDNMMNVPGLAGKAAPDFQVKSLDGKSYNLSELRNKVVLLDFWASWCVPCRQEVPFLNNLYRELKEKDLVVIAVDVGEDRQTVERFLKTAGMSYPVALTSGTDIASDYHATTYPTYIVIGRDGVVSGEQVGGRGDRALRELVAKAYGKSLSGGRVAELLSAANSARSSHNSAAAEEAYNKAMDQAISKETALISSVAVEASFFFIGQQEQEKAEAILKRAMDAQDAPGWPPSVQIPVLMRLREISQSRRNVDLEPVDTRLVKAWESMAGPESVVVARSLSGLSDSLLRKGQVAEAEKVIQRCLAILEKNYGKNAPQLGFALSRLASIETRLGKNDLAKEARDRDSAIRPKPAAPVYRAGGGVTEPRVTFKRDSGYTEAARNARIQGNVLLSLVVETNGEASDITVILPLGNGLDEEAVEAVKAWRFQPGTKDGQPVRVLATISLDFRLL